MIETEDREPMKDNSRMAVLVREVTCVLLRVEGKEKCKRRARRR